MKWYDVNIEWKKNKYTSHACTNNDVDVKEIEEKLSASLEIDTHPHTYPPYSSVSCIFFYDYDHISNNAMP